MSNKKNTALYLKMYWFLTAALRIRIRICIIFPDPDPNFFPQSRIQIWNLAD